MIHVRLVDFGNTETYLDKKIIFYQHGKTFLRVLGGSISEEEKTPPFRDEESMLFIREIDQGKLVEGDWYSYVSPYGRTCMSSLCGGTQYALTAIYYSRKGLYLTYENYEEDIWQRLNSLDMDILIAYDPYRDNSGVPEIPYAMRGCVVEDVSIGGCVYPKAICDAKWKETFTDENGTFHFDGDLRDYEWKWWEHLPEIFEIFRKDYSRQGEMAVTEGQARTCQSGAEFAQWLIQEAKLCNYWSPEDLELFRSREIRNHMTEFWTESSDKYPRGFYISKYRDGSYTVTEKCPVKWPNYVEALNEVIEWWKGDAEETFCVFIDVGCFFEPDHFNQEKLWYFHDDGKTMDLYSGKLGMKKLFDFVGNAVEEGKMKGRKIRYDED